MNTNLTLHCGANHVAREQLATVTIPEATDTWFPIGHEAFVGQVESALNAANMIVIDQAHALTREGQRYFGLMQVECRDRQPHQDFAYVLGLRNSMDMSYPIGLVVGESVFVCDNLSFSGEIRIARKHTRFAMRDLPGLTGRAVGMLADRWTTMENRIARYKNYEVCNLLAHDLLVRSLDVGAATPQQLPRILDEWRHPRHTEFQPRNAWSLFNAFTEVGKESSLALLPKRTMALHMLMDAECGIAQAGAESVLAGTEDATVELN